MAATEATYGVMKSGTAANERLALDGAGKIPAVPGDQLTGLTRGLALESFADLTNAGSNDINNFEWSGLPPGLSQSRLWIVSYSVKAAVRIAVRLGTSSGLAVTGYTGFSTDDGGTSSTFSDGFRLPNSDLDAALAYTSFIELTEVAANVWACQTRTFREGVSTGITHTAFGHVTLAGELSRIRVLTGSNADLGLGAQEFDAGKAALYTDRKS